MKIGYKKFYSGVLSIPAGTLKGVKVRHLHKPAGTVLESGTLRTALYGQTSEALTFDEPTVWHELSEKKHGVWMTDLPVEQRQHDELIQRAKGRVLVGGLGLGYAVVALAARKKVKEIVVVERSAAIITLVWAAAVARAKQMREETTGTPLKLTVVHADLFEYLMARQAARKARPEFAWGLFDIWQGDGETTFHEVVVPLRALAHGVVASLVCWNEDIMRGQMLQGLQQRLMMVQNPEQFGKLCSLDTLTKDTPENIWVQWAVPFWRWYADHQDEDPGLVDLMMTLYVKNYGRPEAVNGIPQMRPYRSVEPEAAEATA